MGDPVEANDANDDRLTYSLEADSNATHADLFQIDRMTGQVTVGLDQQVNPDSDTDTNVPTLGKGDSFTVTIKATDPSGQSAMVVMTITVDEGGRGAGVHRWQDVPLLQGEHNGEYGHCSIHLCGIRP